jgi:NADH dehydrogenase
MAAHASKIIAGELKGEKERPPFHYFDKGMLATIGRAKAVAAIHGLYLKGFIAWAIWAVVHIAMLINFRSRISVMIEWAWYWFFFERGARLITEERGGEEDEEGRRRGLG